MTQPPDRKQTRLLNILARFKCNPLELAEEINDLEQLLIKSQKKK